MNCLIAMAVVAATGSNHSGAIGRQPMAGAAMITVVEPPDESVSLLQSSPAPLGRTKSELLATVSASRLGIWLSCRLKFYFRYVLGIPKPNTPARHVGTAVHAVLQQWNFARWRRAPLDCNRILKVFEQAWSDRHEENPSDSQASEDEAAAKVGALGLLQMYLRDTPIPPGEKPEAVEVLVEKDLGSHGLPTLVGVLDLVRSGGRIVDYKTAAKAPK